jgi:uncharacterized protein YdhG (YjbR/CyaY superfamily)
MTTEKRLFQKKEPNQNFTTTNELRHIHSYFRIIENPNSRISMAKTAFKTVNEYWNAFDGITLEKMQELHTCIHEAIPEATSCISYNMPAIKKGKIIAYYAGYKNHIGFYPLPKCILHFEDQLKPYKTSKGAVQFSLLEPLPLSLIAEMVRFNAASNS